MMKYIFFLWVAILVFTSCDQKPGTNNDQTTDTLSNQSQITNNVQPKSWTTPADLMTMSDAETILGGKAIVMDTMTSIESDVLTYKSTHTAFDIDTSGKLSNLYFMYEDFPTEAAAKIIYKSIRNSNQANPGFVQLGGMGDEAYYHSDEVNFYFFMSRNGKRVIRMKVNKVTGRTSLADFKATAKRITDSL